MTSRSETTKGRRMLTVAGMALALFPVADAMTRTVGSGSLSLWGSGHLAAQSVVEERLFLAARSLINQTNWQEAANRFQELRASFPGGYHVNDSFYWEAFARHRLGERQQAVLLLDNMLEQVPDTISTDGADYHRVNDARQLRLRILGEMAEQGDPRAAQEVLRQSELAIGPTPDSIPIAMLLPDTVEEAIRDAYWQMDATRWELLSNLDDVVLEVHDVPLRSFHDMLELYSDGTLRLTNRRQLPAHCDEASVQQEALSALMRLETDRVEILRSVIERSDECSVNLRAYAVERLAREETEEAQLELIALTTGHPDPETRRMAVQGLRRFDTQAAVDALAAVLTQSNDAEIQGAAIQGLQRSENAGALTALETYAADASRPEGLREDAIVALGRRTDIDPGVLIRLYPVLDTEELKSALIGRLRRIAEEGNEQAETWLFDLTFDVNESVDIRSEALDAWSRSPSLPLSVFTEAYGRHGQRSESKLRERIFYALYRRLERASDDAIKSDAVVRMVELARMETDPEVRERAVYWLGRTGSPEAVQFLLELLRGTPRDTLPRNG
ncbi:MAG: HEAT repeat domain-containing protein [Gemmatimonadota bacterium]|nr:HEAT repeat domain-containing protein [Gemmatimonadota bacterium]MDE2865561.1 HEAT repeat domain-containing protein [Gemmatimonadota bacterium]